MSLYSTEEVRLSPLYQQMYYSRSKMSEAKRNATRETPSKYLWEFPYAAEREYSIWIDQELRKNVVQPVNNYVNQNYVLWALEAKRDSVHDDGIMDIIRGIAHVTRKAFTTAAKILKVGNRVNSKNDAQWGRFVKEATGVNMNMYTPTAQRYVQEWVDLNHDYLSGLSSDYARKISQIVSQGVADGESKNTISKKVVEAGKAFRGMVAGSQRRASRIAVDQVGKLNSTLSRARMAEALISIYKWETAADERVRGTPGGKYPKSRYSHYIMDQKFKQVDNASKISSDGENWRRVRGREEPRHAGQAISCRCTMIPSFIQLKTVVDKDIRRSR